MPARDSFYIATPIFYVNDVPHIGHAYTEVAADVLARWHRQAGDDTWLLTGTDEHGQKILRTAVANDTTPKEWADTLVTDAWLPLLKTINIANDDFIRTTDERHEKAVTTFLQKLYDDGFIYSGEYEGYYCVGCEEYKQLDDLMETADGDFAGQLVCKIHGRPVEILKEKNYFFRMSDFQQKLLDLYESQPDFIQPESVRNEIRLHPAGERAQRDHLVREAGARRPVHLPFELRLGHPDPLGSQPRGLCLVRRAAQLHLRDRLWNRHGELRTAMAGCSARG